MEAPLKGIRVLDFGMAAVGPISAEWMGWLGADVIKIESPSGDIVRRGGHGGAPGWAGHTFNGNNIGKRGIILDLKQDADREIAVQLAKTADILLENFRSPEILERLGLGWSRLREINPRLIYLQSSAWGPVGPMVGKPSFEWVTQAFGGFTSVTGQPGGAPEFSRGIAGFDWNGAMINLEALLIALYVRNRTGEGMRINTSQFQSTLVAATTRLAEYFANGEVPRPMGSARPNFVPDQAFATSDDQYITVTALHDRMWQQLCAAIDQPELVRDPRFETVVSRVEHRDALLPLLEDTFSRRSSADWCARLRAADVPVGEFQKEPTLAESLLADPQVQDQHMVRLLEQTGGGDILTAEPHWHWDKTEASFSRPAPRHGEHQDEVIGSLKDWTAQPVQLVPGDTTGLALAGLKVLDLSQGVSGPICAMQLGDLGAEVTKIEPPAGDWMRQVPPFVGGESAVFLQINRNKRGIAADLKTSAGLELARRLAREADIVVEGYRPGVMERLGLDYATLSAENPRLIYCSITGRGTTGPQAHLRATELDVQAQVGANRSISTPAQPPARHGYDQSSTTAGLAGTQGILAALLYRDRTGLGQHVEVSMLGASIGVHQWTFTAERHPDDRVSNAFLGLGAQPDYGWRTAEGPVLINIREYESGWVPFLKALGLGDLLQDPRFFMEETLKAYLDDLHALVEERTSMMTFEEVRHVVEDEVGATFALMLDFEQLEEHPQTNALGMMPVLKGHPTAGDTKTVKPAWIFDRELASVRTPAPLLGQDTVAVLRAAGYSEEQVRALAAAGEVVVGTVPVARG